MARRSCSASARPVIKGRALACALGVAVAGTAVSGCGGGDEIVRVGAGLPATVEVERATDRVLEAERPLAGVAARVTYCATELRAADAPLSTADGSVFHAYGWATCQQLAAGRGERAAQLRGGQQISQPVRVTLHRDGGRLAVDAVDGPQQGPGYEASMRELMPERARDVVDRVSPAQFDARIDRLLCANLAAARERLQQPDAELVAQGERC